MVGPISESERSEFARKLKAVLVAVVGLSAGLVALGNGASLVGVAVAAAAGFVVGLVLVRIVFPGSGGVG